MISNVYQPFAKVWTITIADKGTVVSLMPPVPSATVPNIQLDILSPTEGEVIQHPKQIAIRYSPALEVQFRNGAQLQVWVDGALLKSVQKVGPVLWGWPNRGEHNLQLKLVASDGRVIEQSGVRSLTVHRPHIKAPNS